MNRLLARVAVATLAVPLTLGAFSGTAQADHLCVGATSVGFVCDPSVEATLPVTVEKYVHQEKVCAVECLYYWGTLYRVEETGDALTLCVSVEDEDGNATEVCPVG